MNNVFRTVLALCVSGILYGCQSQSISPDKLRSAQSVSVSPNVKVASTASYLGRAQLGTLTVAAAPIEAGLLLGAIGGGIAANYLYGSSTAPGFLRRFYYSSNGAPSAQQLPPEK